MLQLQGTGVSFGYAAGPIFVLRTQEPEVIMRALKNRDEIIEEIQRFEKAIHLVSDQFGFLISEARRKYDIEFANILEAHYMMAQDREMIRGTIKLIEAQSVGAEYAFSETMDRFIQPLVNSRHAYQREKVVDLQDVKRRILEALMGHAQAYAMKKTSRRCCLFHRSLDVFTVGQVENSWNCFREWEPGFPLCYHRPSIESSSRRLCQHCRTGRGW